ncbi:MAG: DUF2309 domain-containing protein [Bacteroidia bacterium]|nr:DUF2309 domain-containing protein [Bacteroidia bacterium]
MHHVVSSSFDEHQVLHDLKHYLPSQAPLKDFIHHNSLHAFDDQPFFEALRHASAIFGYKTSLSLEEYRSLYHQGRISDDILLHVLTREAGEQAGEWRTRLLSTPYDDPAPPRIGALRARWKQHAAVDLDAVVHPLLFRVVCSYLDQGIAIWRFPVAEQGFLEALRTLERSSMSSLFQTRRARSLLMNSACHLPDLLGILVGDRVWYERYLFDQQFAHQGWSGLISAIEDHPETLLIPRPLSLHDLVVFECLLEIDALESALGHSWEPLSAHLRTPPEGLFAPVLPDEKSEALRLWQLSFEWSYFDQVLAGLRQLPPLPPSQPTGVSGPRFQALFCIDDRECSFRRYLEQLAPACETFGTPGFFGIETYYQPDGGKFYTKVCPAPVTPRHLIYETGAGTRNDRDPHFTRHAHTAHGGWLISQTLGYWSALKLFWQVFMPGAGPTTASALRHMDHTAQLVVKSDEPPTIQDGLQVGFTVAEMADRVEKVLRSIGLVRDFAPLVYVVGHGASSVNNPHYAAYDCGACSGRAGSVNARAFAIMANTPAVRHMLHARGLVIPEETWFVGGLRDTTRDDVVFYDTHTLPGGLDTLHAEINLLFEQALDLNAKERSRRFEMVNTARSAGKVHQQVRLRSVSIFEPRPELNHATNALCIIGRRSLSRGLFLDRRSFLNSYDYQQDPDGIYLAGILQAAAPVCGGINLEYYFSRVDNEKLGAGSKLPHNVMGLIGVANGIDGDLRPGLPVQMVEVHDPVRLLMIIEHQPEVVLAILAQHPATAAWFALEWILLVVAEPETRSLYCYQSGQLVPYHPVTRHLETIPDLAPLLASRQENFPVYLLHNPSL